jgi:hypothetical protein
MTHVGFTGTRVGMTNAQWQEVLGWLGDMHPGTFHHGDCKGADAQAHDIARDLGWYIVVHPPSDDRHRAFCDGDEIREPKPYLDRDRDIAGETAELIAAPATAVRVPGSGSWFTIGYARQIGKPVRITVPGSEGPEGRHP